MTEGFERARRDRERRWRQLSCEERLRWLEETKRFCARYLGAARAAPPREPPR